MSPYTFKPVFAKSSRSNKKYMVRTPLGRLIHFGAIRDGVPMAQYMDNTGLGLYSNYDHLDPVRRKNYKARHSKVTTKDGRWAFMSPEQPAFYSYRFLW